MADALAQLVEQWTENPCVPGSIPGGVTIKSPCIIDVRAFCFSSQRVILLDKCFDSNIVKK